MRGGIYEAAIAFDANGDVIGLNAALTPLVDTGLVDQRGTPSNPNDDEPNVLGFDGSPDGTQLAWGSYTTGLQITDFGSGATWSLNTDGYSPSFSPDGVTVAYVYENQHIALIDTDGSNHRTIVSLTSKRRSSSLGRTPHFSPAGNQLVYVKHRHFFVSGDTEWDLYRVNADGSGNTELTGQMSAAAVSVGWRE